MAINDFSIIRRSLIGRLFLTVTTVLTVAVAVALMLVLLSLKDAGFRAFQRGSGNMHLIVSRDASPLVSVLNGVFYANPPRNPIDWPKYEEIANGFPFEYAIPIQQGDSYRGFPVLATTEDFFSAFSPDPRPDTAWALANGSFFADTWEIVIGAEVASETGLAIGDELELSHGASGDTGGHEGEDAHAGHVHDDHTFRVVGILEPTGGPHDRALFCNLESSWVLHAHDRRLRDDPTAHIHTYADDLIEEDRLVTGIYLRVATRRGRQVSGALQQVFDQLRRDTSITVAQPGQQIQQLFAIVSNIDQVFIGLAAVVLVSSGIAILLALYSATEQRRRQIAVLRVLGFSRSRIFGLVLTESAVVGLIGAVAGVVIGVVGGQLIATIMKQRLGLVIEPAPLSEWTLVLVVGTIAMAAVAGLIPALLAYRTPVARNLAPLG